MWAESIADAQIGETLWMSNGQFGRHARDLEVEVIKRGRSLLTVKAGWREWTVRMNDGKDSKHKNTTPGPASYVFTEAMRLQRERLVEINEIAKALGIRREYPSLSDSHWEAVVLFAQSLDDPLQTR